MTTAAVALPAVQSVRWSRQLRQVVVALAALLLLAWTVFPFLWILLTSLKSPGDILAVPPTFTFSPTLDNYAALVMGEQRAQYSSTPDPVNRPRIAKPSSSRRASAATAASSGRPVA